MSRRSLLVPALLAGLVSSAAGVARAEVSTFELDQAHTIFGFRASTLLFDVPGRFNQYKVQLSGDPATGQEARVRVEIDARSIDTGNKKRDEHLRSGDFFDVGKFPKIVFTSESVKREGEQLVVQGTLEMHGVKRPLRLPFSVVTAKNGAGYLEHVYKAELPLDRRDFGIGADSVAARVSMKDQVQLTLLLAGFFNPKK